MKVYKIYIGIIFYVLMPSDVSSQANNQKIINELRAELFPQETRQVFLYEVIKNDREKSNKRCFNEWVDSTLTIRNIQPNKNTIQPILKSIAMSKDTNMFTEVINIYNQHMENYKIEWQRIEMKNAYPCDKITDQFDILKSFEMCLMSLYLQKNNFTSKQIFDFAYNLHLLNRSFLHDINNRSNYYAKYLIFNENYRLLLRKGWFRGHSGFTYLEPYILELTPYYVEIINRSSAVNDPNDEIFTFILNNEYLMRQMDEKEITEAFSKIVSHYFALDKEYVLYQYIENTIYANSLVELVAQNWVTKDYKGSDQYIGAKAITKRNNNYLAILADAVLDYAKDNHGKKLNYLNIFEQQDLKPILIAEKNKIGINKNKKDIIITYLKDLHDK